MGHKDLETYLLKKPGAWLDYPFGEDVAVYKVGPKEQSSSTGSPQSKMFALIKEGSSPAVVSLKCRPELAEELRKEYETVMPGYHLNKKYWNTIIATGQMEENYLFGLVDLSYQLVVEGLPKEVQAQLTVG